MSSRDSFLLSFLVSFYNVLIHLAEREIMTIDFNFLNIFLPNDDRDESNGGSGPHHAHLWL